MLKGLVITPPVLGRISIGKVVEKAGKRLPEKDDQFTITSQVQCADGWLPHPFDEGFRKAQGGKIRAIPIRLLFNDPDLNFRAEYALFDRRTGRPVCVGNGENHIRGNCDGACSVPHVQRMLRGHRTGYHPDTCDRCCHFVNRRRPCLLGRGVVVVPARCGPFPITT